MKHKFLILFLFFLIDQTNAQCLDCFKKDWKFSAGVTLYNNNKNGVFASEKEHFLERRPLEFNFRYIKNSHALRMSIPMDWKVKRSGEPTNRITNYQIDETIENKALAYLDAIKHDKFYSEHTKTIENYYNTIGITLGYDYSLPIVDGFNIFAGVDLSFNYIYMMRKWYNVTYIMQSNNLSNLDFLSYIEIENNFKAYSIKPLLGFRFNYQKLIFETNLGYSFSNYYSNGTHLTHLLNSLYPKNDFNNNYTFNKILYQFSLYYTF
jgi:hypothetical protein